MRRNSIVPALVMVLVSLAPQLQAHPVHQSTAEVEYNLETKRLEVALTVDLNDLELALTRQCDQALSLAKTSAEEFDAQTQIYLARNFEVTDGAGKVAKLAWVGRESVAGTAKSADPAVRLFFEVPLAGGITDVRLQHSLFNGLFKDQTNLVQFRHANTNLEFRFVREDGAKELFPPAPSAPKKLLPAR